MYERLRASDAQSQTLDRINKSVLILKQVKFESGFDICRDLNDLYVSPVISGTEGSVDLKILNKGKNRPRRAKNLFAFHTHPSGITAPSPSDAEILLDLNPLSSVHYPILAIGSLLAEPENLSVLFVRHPSGKNLLSRFRDLFGIYMQTFRNFGQFDVRDEAARLAWLQYGYEAHRMIISERELDQRKFTDANWIRFSQLAGFQNPVATG